MTATTAPPGIAHLENPELITDLTVARDFDLGITGPPLSISMDFIASGLVEMVGGLATGLLLFGYAWWAAPLLIGAWVSTHYLLRESAVWQDRNTDEVRTRATPLRVRVPARGRPARGEGSCACSASPTG